MTQLDLVARALSRSGGSEARTADPELLAFIQKRVASFGLVLASMFGMFLSWRVLATLLGETDAPTGYLRFQAGTVVAFVGMWLLTRGRLRPARVVRAIELGGITAGCAFMLASGFFIPYAVRPDYILTVAMSHVLVVRSIYIPSRARTTLVLAALIGTALLAATFGIHWRGFELGIYTEAAPPVVRDGRLSVALREVAVMGLWWTVATAVAASASRVIYGLREQVRDARKLGQYTLLDKIGHGGMGEVYRARHALLRRPTAIKLLPPNHLGEDSVARFEREVQLTARLTHPNTVRVFDYGRTPDRVFYYAMEFLDGASLADVVRIGGPMPPARVIHVLEQCAGALAEAHGIGLIHRDIKPANILLTEQGGIPDVAKVVDFGLVKQVSAATGDAATADAITRDDSVAGTPQYMAPETITGSEVDARADLYALGAVGYFLLTGTDVFTGRTVLEICSHHLQSAPEPPSRRLGRPVPADLEQLVLGCLAKAPDGRPASARALRDALRACGDAGAWTEEDARAWWATNGPALHPARAAGAPADLGGASTLAVDVSALSAARDDTPARRG